MPNPFDAVVAEIRAKGYHNHRLEGHSDLVSNGLLSDLIATCEPFKADYLTGRIKAWKNVGSPGDRERRIDLFVGESGPGGKPDLNKVRLVVENKSVITAHRNKTNRFDDLKKVLDAVLTVKREAIIVATVLIGLAERVLNVPDHVRKHYAGRNSEFEKAVLPRLSLGDQSLWDDFPWAISKNRRDDPIKTMEHFQKLPTRNPGHTHVMGYDYVLLVPIYIDNVSKPYLPRENILKINIDDAYADMLSKICKAYTARWHL